MIESRNHSNLSPTKLKQSLSVSQIQPLKTPFTFESQQNSYQNSQIAYSEKQYKFDKEYFRDDTYKRTDTQTHDENIKKSYEKQYTMKLQSVVKSYELKLTKEQQTFQLAQLKYKEQIQYLKRQIKQMAGMKQSRTFKSEKNSCSICSNGQVIIHMKNMLQSIEADHKNCLKRKGQLNEQILDLQTKLGVLQSQLERSQGTIRKIRQETRVLRHEKDGWERQKRQKDKIVRDLERQYHVKQAQIKNQMQRAKQNTKKQQQRLIELLYQQKINKQKQNEDVTHLYSESNPLQQSSLHNIALNKAHQNLSKVQRYYEPKYTPQSTVNISNTIKGYTRNLHNTTFDTFRPTMNRFKYDY